jgi:hypothetical protein
MQPLKTVLTLARSAISISELRYNRRVNFENHRGMVIVQSTEMQSNFIYQYLS